MRRFLRVLCAVLALAALSGAVSAAWASSKPKKYGAYYITVSVAKNRISIYRQIDGKWKKLGTKRCSTGAMWSQTPKGTYRIKKKRYTFNNYGQNWYYVTYFHKDYAIHSTGESGGKFDNSTLGQSTSHGCVRVKPKYAKWIYDNIPTGTYITIE